MPRIGRRGSRAAFEFELRASVRGLWAGEYTAAEFQGNMLLVLDVGYRGAWMSGATDFGINSESELTDAELNALNTLIFEAYGHVAGLAEFVQEHSRANGGLLGDCVARLPLWYSRYDQAVNQGRVMAGQDQKLMWVLGRTEQSCSSCLKLAGQVRRGSFWYEHDVLPRVPNSPVLACGGWRCDCSLVPTDEPMSRGRLPSLP